MHLIHAAPHLVELVAVEPSSLAAEQCNYNLESLILSRSVKKSIKVMSLEDVPLAEFNDADCLISNPPYLPTPPWLDTKPINPAFDTGLLSHVITIATQIDAPLALLYSHLSTPEVDRAIRATGNPVTKSLAIRHLPLRLSLQPNYVQWLVENRGLQERDDHVFKYWHTIEVILVNP